MILFKVGDLCLHWESTTWMLLSKANATSIENEVVASTSFYTLGFYIKLVILRLVSIMILFYFWD